MTTREQKSLLSEAAELRRMIAETPPEFAIDKLSLESRLEEVESEVRDMPKYAREPARGVLTFGGKPVVGSHGIFAEFGANAVGKFMDALSLYAASLSGSLRSGEGPIPDRAKNRVLITGTAHGSFGFELEEDLSQKELESGPESVVAQAFVRMKDLLESTLESDDELSERLVAVDDRVIRTLREYLDLLAKAEAVCAFQFQDEVFRFRDVGQVRRSAGRLSDENVHDEEEELNGEFEGAVPHYRRFEFKCSDTGDIIYGTVHPSVQDVGRINDMRHRRVTIHVRAKWVGNGRPNYMLLELPEEAQNSPTEHE